MANYYIGKSYSSNEGGEDMVEAECTNKDSLHFPENSCGIHNVNYGNVQSFNFGWMCPRCGKVWSPSIPCCTCDQTTISTDTKTND